MQFELHYDTRVQKELNALDTPVQKRILRAISALATNPYPSGSRNVRGTNYFRIRVGDYRVIYEVHFDMIVIIIVRIGHRRNAYDWHGIR